MQLTPRADLPPPSDVTELLRVGASRLGHRPAVTVLHAAARYEQSGVSLANWAAKGAHVLDLDHLVGPGTVVGVDAPACWTVASVVLATWWLGATVRLAATPPAGIGGAGDRVAAGPVGSSPEPVAADAGTEVAAVNVWHERAVGAAAGAVHGAGEVLLVGDALDGGPTGPAAHPIWTHEAQPMPDAAPPHAATADRVALVRGTQRWTQGELLALAGTLGDGVLGVEVDRVDPVLALVASAIRPFLTGQATVLLRDVDREAATPERVSVWCGASAG